MDAPSNRSSDVAVPADGQSTADTGRVDVVRVLDAVTALCDRVVEYIEADRTERRLVIDALTRVAQSLDASATRAPDDGSRVLGGSMPATDENTVDLRERATAVEVRCRFGDRWVDGFEIFDVVSDQFGVRYRLRRRVDGVVLPELFRATDIRHVETFEELSTASDRRWNRL
jgi:hypothetical protein